ncbi:hypothetical protein E2562_017040 [Oryza meyeriana var. granulata]|uniref:Uncharacterized protein n=1 Tax=Oryza meyeriana var. granulata TaxID=110450 RepID=A0A6G1F8Q8_9ORYZ|nr:hypothetical protein E2562_017040 [Oryza meyeriana var. granulata]
MLNSRLVMNQFLNNLRKESKLRKKKCTETLSVLREKEEELAHLRTKLKLIEDKGTSWRKPRF